MTEQSYREKAAAEVRQVTLVGLFFNLFTSLTQLIAGYITGSRALIADAVHSFSDLLSDGIVLLANHFANVPADEDHPYGHGKYEALGTTFVSALLIVTGGAIAVHAFENFGVKRVPSSYAIVFALMGVVIKEGLFQYTRQVGTRLRSELLLANAWHHRSDAFSSIATFAGTLGAVLGYPILDPVAALVVGLFIVKAGFQIGWHGLQELLDTSLEVDLLQDLQEIALADPRALGVHKVRARRMGPYVLVDLHLDVPGHLTVYEAHGIAETVEQRILERFPRVSEVLIHIDPSGPDEAHEHGD